MGWGKEMNFSPIWSFLYTPFSDSVVRAFVHPRSFAGRLFTHNGGFGTGLVAMGVSYGANKTYDMIAKQKPLSPWLEKGQTWKHEAVQLATRAITHVVFGSGVGLAMSLLMPSFEMTPGLGVAVGATAFIGPQLARLIYKTVAWVFSKIRNGLGNFATKPAVQEWVDRQAMPPPATRAEVACSIYNAMGMPNVEQAIKWASIAQVAHDLSDALKSDLNLLSMRPTFYNTSHINLDDGKFIASVLKAVEQMTHEIISHENGQINAPLIQRLSWQVIYSFVNMRPELLNKCEYTPGMNDPFYFIQPIPVSLSDISLINKVYDKVRGLVPINNAEDLLKPFKDQLLLEQEESLKKDFSQAAKLSNTNAVAKHPDPRAFRTIMCCEYLNQIVENIFCKAIPEEIPLLSESNIQVNDQYIQLTDIELKFINTGIARANFFLVNFLSTFTKFQEIYDETFKKFALNPGDYNRHILPWLLFSCRVVAVSNNPDSLKALEETTTLQLFSVPHTLTEREKRLIKDTVAMMKEKLITK